MTVEAGRERVCVRIPPPLNIGNGELVSFLPELNGYCLCWYYIWHLHVFDI